MVFKKLRYNTLKTGLNIFMKKKMLLPLLKFNKYLEKFQDTEVSPCKQEFMQKCFLSGNSELKLLPVIMISLHMEAKQPIV